MAERAVTITFAPSAVPSWMAKVPMPLPPPCTSSVSPMRSRASCTTFDQTVQATSGRPAASIRSTAAGTGSNCPAGTATRSRVAAAGEQGTDLLAHRQPVTSGAIALITPEHSSPGYGEAPFGGG